MADKAAKRVPRWAKVLSGLLIGIVLVVVLSSRIIRSLETRRWAEMRRYCEDVAKEVRSRDSRRPVLRGEPVDGNAWDDYQMALDTLELNLDVSPLKRVLSRRPSADQPKAQALVERHLPALQALRRGASRSHSIRHAAWENGSDPPDRRPNNLALLAAGQARFLADAGRPREAMELLLDTAQYGEDTALNGSGMDGLLGVAHISVALDELKEILSPERLSSKDYQQLAREFELLDRGFPREAEGSALEAMVTGFDFLKKGNLAAVQKHLLLSDPAQATWDYGFSDRLVMADFFRSAVSFSHRSGEAAGKPWKASQEIRRQIEAEVKYTRNPLLRRLLVIRENLADQVPMNVFRHRRTQLRLLRGVVAYRATGAIPVLEDPYGDKILSSTNGSRLKLWSVGGDGVDDGGLGDWDLRGGKDIVLEFDR